MRTSLAALLCCLLVASLAGAAAVAGAPSTADSGTLGTAAPSAPPATAVDTAASDTTAGDATTGDATAADGGVATLVDESGDASQSEDNRSRPESIEIGIDADGDAHFVLAKEFPAETDAEQRAFDRLADEYRRGQHGDLGFAAYESAFEAVDGESDRNMQLIDDGRHTVREDGAGRLEYRFTWTNFAELEEASVSIGDAFGADGDVWLQLYDGQRLVIKAPDGYGVATSPSGPEIEDDALIWTGPTTFSSGELDVTFRESPDESSGFPTTLLLGLGLAFLLVGLLALLWWLVGRRSGEEGVLERSVRDRLSGVLPEGVATTGGAASGAPNTSESSPDPSDGASEEAGAATDAEPSAAPGASGAAGETVDPELLSDEERVEHLLEDNGGRMKQANIVSETGWSNAKVSQLLSRMAEEDRVDKLRIGRENLITLPDVDVTEGNGDDA